MKKLDETQTKLLDTLCELVSKAHGDITFKLAYQSFEEKNLEYAHGV